MKIPPLTCSIYVSTSKTLAGSDAVHKDPDYSCAYVVINTDAEDEELVGHGLTFSLVVGMKLYVKLLRPFRSFN